MWKIDVSVLTKNNFIIYNNSKNISTNNIVNREKVLHNKIDVYIDKYLNKHSNKNRSEKIRLYKNFIYKVNLILENKKYFKVLEYIKYKINIELNTIIICK